MAFKKHIALMFVLISTGVYSGPISKLASYYNNTFTARSSAGATLQAVDFQPGNLGVGGASLSFISNDSIFLRSANVYQLLCVGCPPGIDDRRLDSFPVLDEYRGLPLQKLVRVYFSQVNGQQFHFLVARHNQVVHYFFSNNSTSSSAPTQLISKDSITVPMAVSQSIYGIDDFFVDSNGDMSFKVFGKAGLRASVTVSSHITNFQTNNFPDTLDISAASSGVFGTVQGQILDSTLNWKPVKIGNKPIALVNSEGAGGDSGLFALKIMGAWRAYPQGADSLRDFAIKLSDVLDSYTGGSPNTFGNWGTHATFWNNHFQGVSRFIKDDSTLWVNSSVTPPSIFSKDSIFTYSGMPDSVSLSLFDSDNNYSHPGIVANRFGASIPLNQIWGKFSKGCGTGGSYDTITCFPSSQAPKIILSWKNEGVRIRSTLSRGAWVMHLDPYSSVSSYYYTFSSVPLQIDTLVPWIRGYNFRIEFQNASYTLVNDAYPISLHSSASRNGGLYASVSGRQIQWKGNDAAKQLVWELHDIYGVKLIRGESADRTGTIQTVGLVRGVYFLTLSNPGSPEEYWRGKIFLE